MNGDESIRWQLNADRLVALVEEQFRVLAGGFAVEIALAWPVIGETVADPVIASAGSHDRVRVRPAQVFRYAIRRRADAVARPQPSSSHRTQRR